MNPTIQNQIRIVVPVSLSDVHLLEPWLNAFRALGGAPRNVVEFFPTPSVTAATMDAAKAIRDFCLSTEVRPTGKEFSGGWPKACNAHFGHAMRDMAIRGLSQPWLWNELDALGMVPMWADRLSNEYLLTGGRGAMGVIMPVVKILNKGQPNQYVHIDDGDLYMVGVGIYDPMYYLMLEGIADQLFGVEEPFDVFLRYYTKKAWRSTEQITTMSRTMNYRIEGDEMVCDDVPGKRDEYEMRGGIVPRGTSLFHHGCKDDSLARLLVAEAGKPWQSVHDMLLSSPVSVSVAALPPVPQPVATQPSAPIPEGGNDAQLAAVFAQQRALHPEGNGMPHPAQAPTGDAEVLDKLKTAIRGAPRAVKIANWATELGIPEETLRSVATKKGSGVKIVHGGWARLGS